MYRPCTSLRKVNLYITVLGGDFWKYLNGEFDFHATIKILYSFIVCRIPFLQGDVHLQAFTKQYFIANKLFWENWVKLKMQNLPIHVYSESVLHIWYLFDFPFAKLLRKIFLSLRIRFARKPFAQSFAKVISRKIALFRFCKTQVLHNYITRVLRNSAIS